SYSARPVSIHLLRTYWWPKAPAGFVRRTRRTQHGFSSSALPVVHHRISGAMSTTEFRARCGLGTSSMLGSQTRISFLTRAGSDPILRDFLKMAVYRRVIVESS